MERENMYLPLDPQKTYVVRITLLRGELFPLVYDTLMRSNTTAGRNDRTPFMQIGKQQFSLEEVILSNDDFSGWTGFVSLPEMVEKIRCQRLSTVHPLTLEFASLTTFNRTNIRSKNYGIHHARLPLPLYVFPGLARRWEEIAGPNLATIVQRNVSSNISRMMA